MNAKLDLLEQMTNTLAAPRTKARAVPATGRPLAPRVDLRPAVRRNVAAAPTQSLWRATLAEAQSTVAERALVCVLVGVGVAGLGWLAFTAARFFLAWEGLVAWVRAAMVG